MMWNLESCYILGKNCNQIMQNCIWLIIVSNGCFMCPLSASNSLSLIVDLIILRPVERSYVICCCSVKCMKDGDKNVCQKQKKSVCSSTMMHGLHYISFNIIVCYHKECFPIISLVVLWSKDSSIEIRRSLSLTLA